MFCVSEIVLSSIVLLMPLSNGPFNWSAVIVQRTVLGMKGCRDLDVHSLLDLEDTI